ncbi:MAG: glycosyltransferase family 1 protein [Clostridia bacterium]|nr:glycosyltransferase family 1 protein [Clostridia bacterium]
MEQKTIRIAQIMGKWVGGGVEAVVMNYYQRMDKSKVQFDFICDDDSTNIPYEEIKKLGGKVITIPPYQKILTYHKQLKKVLQKGNYKIVHSHINTLSVFSLWAAKSAKVPIRIAHSHSTTNKKEKKKNLMKQILRHFSKLFATDYMCCSELAGRWLFGDKEYEKGKVYLLNNAIDVENFQYNETIRKDIRKEWNIKEETLVIGHIGRFCEQKNHSFLIDIFKQVNQLNRDSILVLVGQGNKMKEIKEKVEQLDLQKNVIFYGQRDDINRVYQGLDAFVFPSIYEGLGMVLIEAQCSNLYCITSTEVPTSAKINENIDYLSLLESPNTWANKILENSKQKIQRELFNQAIQDRGYDIKREEKKLTKKYLKLYERIKEEENEGEKIH